jgi:hypothetical protein
MGDINAQRGPENEGLERVTGRHGIGNTNEIGERLIHLCANHELVICETVFPHKKCHKLHGCLQITGSYRNRQKIWKISDRRAK